MSDVGIKWYGDDLLAKLEGADDDALFEGAQELVEVAKVKAPRRSGALAESGYAATKGQSTYRKAKGHRREIRPQEKGVAVAAFAMFYAHIQEYGARHHAAAPFLRPALDEARERIGNRIVLRLARDLK